MNKAALIESLILHEDIRLKPYICPAGKTSIGVGRNLDDNGISQAEAMLMLENDIETCMAELDRARPNWRIHSDARQNVLIEMCFNLGMPRLSEFRNMWAALDAEDYELAANEMLRSRWAVQVGERGQTLSEQMRAG